MSTKAHTSSLARKEKFLWIEGIFKGFQMDIFGESDTLIIQHRRTVGFTRVDKALLEECQRLAVNIGDTVRVNVTACCVEIVERGI